jgi:Flp pilus assembly protein CpaB
MVDVILTYRVEFSTEPEAAEVARRIVSSNAAQTVLENVRVMAVDQQAVDASEVGVGRTVTLEVTPKQAEELMLATEMGDLSLALRKIGDDVLYSESESSKTTTTDFRLSNITREVNESVEVDDEKTVKVFSGNQVQEVTITP